MSQKSLRVGREDLKLPSPSILILSHRQLLQLGHVRKLYEYAGIDFLCEDDSLTYSGAARVIQRVYEPERVS